VSGWTKVFLATGLMVVALACFNLALWRRLKEARHLADAQNDQEETPPQP